MTPHVLVGRHVKVALWDDLADLMPGGPVGLITQVKGDGDDVELTVQLGLPVANGQKTTLSRKPARTERAKLRTAEVLAHLEGVLAVGVDVLVTAR